MRQTLLLLLALLAPAAVAQPAPAAASTGPWLFAGFVRGSETGVILATSADGFQWQLVNGGKAVTAPEQPDELMRDPFVQRAPDGSIAMVWTWAWKDQTIGYASSTDLVHWSAHRRLPVMAGESSVVNTWAPALYWEPAQKRWLIFWSSTIPGRFPASDPRPPTPPDPKFNPYNHRIYFVTTPDFKRFTPAKVFFDPGYSVIDATEIQAGGKFHMIYKDEAELPLHKHLLMAEGPTAEGPWTPVGGPISETWSEGAAIIPVQGGYLAFYDHYRSPQHYGALFSTDLRTWTDAAGKISFPPGMRHGSFLKITQAEYDRLRSLSDPASQPHPRI